MTSNSSNRTKLYMGSILLTSFIAILILIFYPFFNGQNGLEYLDALYNSISKGSAYYIPDVKKEAGTFSGNNINVSIRLSDKNQADQTALLYKKSGVQARVSGSIVHIKGDLGLILNNCLEDTDLMYHNKGEKIKSKYRYDEKQVVYNWHKSFKIMEKRLKDQKKFKEAKMVSLAIKKAVECSYNYYKIEPKKITDSLGIVIFSLIFYVVYTLWYGFAVMYIFEGIGLKLEH